MGEYYCNVFSEVYDLPTVCLRYFNVYGPRQDPNGEYAAVIPTFINRVKEDKPLIIYGDGNQTRDFVFVDGVIQANISAVEKNLAGTFNVAGGRDVSINELAASILGMNNELSNEMTNAQNKNIEILYEDFQPGDIRYSFADISKMERCRYEPKYSLEDGLLKTLEWFPKTENNNNLT